MADFGSTIMGALSKFITAVPEAQKAANQAVQNNLNPKEGIRNVLGNYLAAPTMANSIANAGSAISAGDAQTYPTGLDSGAASLGNAISAADPYTYPSGFGNAMAGAGAAISAADPYSYNLPGKNDSDKEGKKGDDEFKDAFNYAWDVSLPWMPSSYAVDRSAERANAQSKKGNSDNKLDTVDDETLLAGMTHLVPKTQRDLYNEAMQDEALRDYYAQNYMQDIYGDLTGDYGYEAFRDIGANNDYAYKLNLVKDLFGLDPENSEHAIQGWQSFLPASGIQLTGDADVDAQAIADYMWGANNITNLDQFVQNQDYDYARHNLGAGSTGDAMANYIANKYFFDDENGLNAFKEAFPGLDEGDIAAWLATGNRLASGQKASESDLAAVQDLITAMGGGGTYKFSDDVVSSGSDWADANLEMTPADLLAALNAYVSQNGEAPATSTAAINGGSSPYYSALIPALAAWMEQGTGKKVVRE